MFRRQDSCMAIMKLRMWLRALMGNLKNKQATVMLKF